MRPTIPQLLQDLRDNVEMLGFDSLVVQVDLISKEYKAEKKPIVKKKTISKPKAKEVILNLEITENGKTNSVRLDEKKAEAYLKLRKKEHSKKVDAFIKSNGLIPPKYEYYNRNTYAELSKEYENKLIEAGHTFSVKISRC